jgi:hypothetical protein
MQHHKGQWSKPLLGVYTEDDDTNAMILQRD